LCFSIKNMYIHILLESHSPGRESQEKIMNTLQSINTRKWLLVPVFAAFAAYAQASQAADSFGDTQSHVRAVLEGARSHVDSSQPATIGAVSRAADIQESTRQILLGTIGSNAGVRAPLSGASAGPSASNRHDSGDVQRQAQRVVLGRAAS
jgi:hypothetical protein